MVSDIFFSYVSWFHSAVRAQALVCCSINRSVPMAAQRDEVEKVPFQLMTGNGPAGLERPSQPPTILSLLRNDRGTSNTGSQRNFPSQTQT